VRALELLVRALELLVRGAQLLRDALELLDRALQVLLGHEELLLELADPLLLRRRARLGGWRESRRLRRQERARTLGEQDQQAAVLALRIRDRQDLEPQAAPAGARVRAAVLDHARVVFERAQDGAPEIGVELGPREPQDVEARRAGQGLEVGPRPA